MSLSLRALSLVAVVVLVSSCGFKPLYAQKGRDGTRSCSNFKVEKAKNPTLGAQRLQYRLQDSLNLACINTDKNYKVIVNVSREREAIAIQKDREITRYNLNLVGSYTVVDTTTNKPVDTGTSIMVGGFDAVFSDYGTYALEHDTEKKLYEEMANDLSLKISSRLLGKK